MNGQDGVVRAELGAAVDHLLRAALDLRVATLHRIEIKLGGIDARGHGTGGTATHANAHARSAQGNEQTARRETDLAGQLRVDGTQAAGDHDGLVIAPSLTAHGLLVLPEVAGQVRPTKFVVEGGAAQGALGHDLQRTGHVGRLAVRLLKDPRDGKARQPRLGP